jgi:uncharacterized protein with PIN domain
MKRMRHTSAIAHLTIVPNEAQRQSWDHGGETVRFIADNNVGRVVGPLRALGYDTLFINPIEDGRMVEIARREGRIILTRDTGIFKRRVVASGEAPALYLRGDDWRRQVAQIVRELHLNTEPTFTRCIACNTLLDAVSRADAEPHVPAYVFRTQEQFLHCPGCNRYYWKGTHWHRMRQALEGILKPG